MINQIELSIIIVFCVIVSSLYGSLFDAWKKMTKNLEEEFDGSFLFDEWYLTEENQTRYIRMYKDDPDFRNYVKEDCNTKLMKYLYQRAIEVNNMINIFTGLAGSGKSDLARWFMGKMVKIRKETLNEDTEYSYCFNASQLLDKIVNMKEGACTQCDEWENMQGDQSKIILNKLDNVITHMRFSRKCVNLCTPMGVRLINTTSIFEPFGFWKDYIIKDRAIKLSKYRNYVYTQQKLVELYGRGISKEGFNKIVRLRKRIAVEIPDTDEEKDKKIEKEIRKQLLKKEDMKTRALWYTIDPHSHKETFQGIISVPIGLELSDDDGYEQAKKENYEKLEKNRGGVSGEEQDRDSYLDAVATELYQFAKTNFKYPKNPRQPEKVDLKMYLTKLKVKTGEDYPMSGKDWDEVQSRITHLATEDFEESQKNQSNQNQMNQQTTNQSTNQDLNNINGEFTYDQEKVFEEIRKTTKSNTINRNIEIYNKLQRDPNYSQENVIKEYPELKTRYSVSVALKPLKNAMDNIIGHLYEDYIFPYFQKIFSNATKLRENGEPDFICIDRKGRTYYISVKCLDFATTYPLLYAEHHAEIKAGREHFQQFNVMPRVISFVYNRYNKKHYTRTIPEIVLKANYPLGNEMKDVLRLEDFDKDNVLESMIAN